MIRKLNYLPLSIVLLSQPVISDQTVTGRYIPPPTGPYKSSVIINERSSQSDSSERVYVFPSDTYISSKRPEKPVFKPNTEITHEAQRVNSNMAKAPRRIEAPAMNSSEKQVQKRPLVSSAVSSSAPVVGQVPRNPWAPDSLPHNNAIQQNNFQNDVYRQNTYQGGNYPANVYQGSAYPRARYTPQSPYQQQHPYGNGNNDFMSNPFNSMTSPWTAMPMQPFFSGK